MQTEHVITNVNMTNIPTVGFWKSGTIAEKGEKNTLEPKDLKTEHGKLNITIPEKPYLGSVCKFKFQTVLTHSLLYLSNGLLLLFSC